MTQPQFFIDSAQILKVVVPKIKHLAPQGRTKTLQKRIRNAILIFHGFYIDFGSHVGDILKVLAASSSQYRLVSCFQMVRFNGQYLKVSAVALQLQWPHKPKQYFKKSSKIQKLSSWNHPGADLGAIWR